MIRKIELCSMIIALTVLLLSAGVGLAEPLVVCTTIPDLGSLAKQVGGDEVAVTVFVKGSEDPHFLEARPSFVKKLSQADLYIQVGLELEVGWAPVLLINSRNAKVQLGEVGHLDTSKFVDIKEIPTGPIDRSMGDVHASGNPHYLLDPVAGLHVAAAIRDTLTVLRPDKKAVFESRYGEFYKKLGEMMVGENLAGKYDLEKMAFLYEHGRLGAFLEKTGESDALGGWLASVLPYRGAEVVADHSLWPYFADRFGVRVVAHLEPKPGMLPTTKHLKEVIEMMNASNVKVIFNATYFPARHAAFVAEKTGGTIVEMAHQVGSRPGTEDYLTMLDFNVRQMVKGFAGK